MNTEPARSIKLPRNDQTLETWRDDLAFPNTEPTLFKRETCLEQLRALSERRGSWRTNAPHISDFPSREEAHFWLLAFEHLLGGSTPGGAAEILARADLDGQMSADRIRQIDLKPTHCGLEDTIWHGYLSCALTLLHADETPQFIRKYVGTYYRDGSWDRPDYRDLGNRIGSVEILLTFIQSIPDGGHKPLMRRCADNVGVSRMNQDRWVPWQIYKLRDPALIENEFRRVGACLITPDHARAWLALTGYGALDIIVDSVAWVLDPASIKRLAGVLLLVAAPEAALPALRLTLEAPGSVVGRTWLNQYPEHTVAGLTPIAMGDGEFAGRARAHLQAMVRGGLQAVVEAAARSSPDQRAYLQAEIIDKIAVPPIVIAAQLPEDLRAAFAQVKRTKPELWLLVGSLPPIGIPGGALPGVEVESLLAELRKVPLGSSSPLIDQLKTQANAGSLDEFARALLQAWVEVGSPIEEKWVLASLGHFGSDLSAHALGEQIRGWNMEKHVDNQPKHIKAAVQCLRAIRTDTAAVALEELTHKPHLASIRREAKQALNAVRRNRRRTTEWEAP